MNNENAKITVFGEEYELMLTLKISDEFSSKYKEYNDYFSLPKEKKTNEISCRMIALTLEMIVLLANQSVLLHNLKNPNNKKEFLTVDLLELIDYSEFERATKVFNYAVEKGLKQHIINEKTKKKTTGKSPKKNFTPK
jgi:hypothetical protein